MTESWIWKNRIKPSLESDGWDAHRIENSVGSTFPDVIAFRKGAVWAIEIKIAKTLGVHTPMVTVRWEPGQLATLKKLEENWLRVDVGVWYRGNLYMMEVQEFWDVSEFVPVNILKNVVS